MNELFTQFINLLGAVLLLLAFAMISQRRILSLIRSYTDQGKEPPAELLALLKR